MGLHCRGLFTAPVGGLFAVSYKEMDSQCRAHSSTVTVLNGFDSPGHCFNLKVIMVLAQAKHLSTQADLLLNHPCIAYFKRHFSVSTFNYWGRTCIDFVNFNTRAVKQKCFFPFNQSILDWAKFSALFRTLDT